MLKGRMFKQPQAGVGLLEMLIALGLLSVVAMGFARLMKNQISAQNHVGLRADLKQIATTVGQLVDCKATLASYTDATGNVTCPSAAGGAVIIPVIDINGNTLVAAPAGGSLTGASKFGGWTVRAMCLGSSDPNPGLVIQAAKPRSTASLYDQNAADFNLDTMTNTPLSWGVAATKNFSGSELFAVNLRPCRATISHPVAQSATCPAGAKFCDHNYATTLVRTGDLTEFGTPPTYSSFCNTGLVTNAAAIYATAASLPNGWTGTASCPAGYVATGGGVDCQDAPVTGSVCGAIMASSNPTNDGAGNANGWYGFCCRTQNCPVVSHGSIWVSCVPMTATAP